MMSFGLALKGLLVLTTAAAIARILRRGAAATRYRIWSTALAGVLLLPVAAPLVPVWRVSVIPAVPAEWLRGEPLQVSQAAAPAPSSGAPGPGLLRPTPRAPLFLPPSLPGTAGAERALTPPGKATPRESASRPGMAEPVFAVPTWLALLAAAYSIGVVIVLGRAALGAAGVIRIVRGARPIAEGALRDRFEQAIEELGIERRVDLLESDATPVPVAWELLRPAVLLPPGAERWPATRQRVALLHELAHVSRRDCQVQLAAQVALAMHWFNPLAWLAVRRLRIEREHACDDRVLSLGTRASDYADHLLQIARGLMPEREPAWASVAMARRSCLERRVAAILDPRNPRHLPQRRTNMIALITVLALLLPLAGLEPSAVAESGAVAEPGPAAETGAAATPAAAPAAQEPQPTIDELVQMRIHGVSIEFIEDVRSAFGRPVTVGELVQMRIHGTTPEFVAGMGEVFPDADVTIRDVTQMRIHGASIEYIREMQAALGGDLTPAHITQLRIHGAGTEYVREMKALLADQEIDAGDITQMRIHGVTLARVRELREEGFENLTVRDLVQMRIHGFDRWLQRRRGGR